MFLNSCTEDSNKDEQTQLILCNSAEQAFTSQVFEGSFYPCRTDGLLREYPATATFKLVSDSTYMHLQVDELDLDTIISYEFWCEYHPKEPMEKVSLNFGDPNKSFLSDYNLYYNSVWAWFQYEESCELGLFANRRN
jgi:hypothetical protein